MLIGNVADIYFDRAGHMYVSEILYINIRVVSPDGIVRRLAVDGIYLALRFSGDGGVCSHAELYKPSGIFIGEENYCMTQRIIM